LVLLEVSSLPLSNSNTLVQIKNTVYRILNLKENLFSSLF
jgi:hypothetical protein